MPHYPPETLREAVLIWLSRFENRIGRKARGILKAVQGPKAVADFEARLAQVGPGDICLDLGANVGLFTAKMADRGCEVHAFEPDPLAWGMLVQNVGQRPNVTLHNCAVAARSGRLRLRRAHDFSDDPVHSTTKSTIVLDHRRRFQDADGIDVDVRAFADVVKGVGRRIAMVKMDIEGAEFDILREVFADPAAFDIDAIFCETHERDAYPEFREIDRMRRESDHLERPHINLYWP